MGPLRFLAWGLAVHRSIFANLKSAPLHRRSTFKGHWERQPEGASLKGVTPKIDDSTALWLHWTPKMGRCLTCWRHVKPKNDDSTTLWLHWTPRFFAIGPTKRYDRFGEGQARRRGGLSLKGVSLTGAPAL